MGFCLFNNIAIASRYLQSEYGLNKIAVVDWDVHHGNGTQDTFYADPSVFFFSIHQLQKRIPKLNVILVTRSCNIGEE